MEQQSILVLTRVRQFRDMLRSYEVLVDDQPVGSIRRNQTLEIPVSPGTHTICLEIDWCSSNELVVTTKPSERIRLECGNNVKPFPWKLFSAITVDRGAYLYVERVS